MSVKDKYNILYHLRSYANEDAAQILKKSYNNLNSELLEHEVMFILGQIKIPSTKSYLIEKLSDKNESPVVRHEAGEALGNFLEDSENLIPILQKFQNDDQELVSVTAKIAIMKLKHKEYHHMYGKLIPGSLEPGPPFEEQELIDFLTEKKYIKEDSFFIWPMDMEISSENALELIQNLGKPLDDMLFDKDLHEFWKYRLIYFFRNKKDMISILLLTKILDKNFRNNFSALLRHEVKL